MKFEEDLLQRGLKKNSIYVYMRTLRAAYNKAIAEGFIKPDLYPFKSYKVIKFKQETLKRALKKDDIILIKDFNHEKYSASWHARNMFLFSYLNRGMNFTDMAQLKWENIKDERVQYFRAKTGKSHSIKIHPESRKILDFYEEYTQKNGSGTEYIFPILNDRHKTAKEKKDRIKTALKAFNKNLQEIADKVGLDINLTSYVARHSWATVLKREGYATAIIQEGLGHSTEKTTQVYLDSFENIVLDEANESII
jgi:integrase